MPAPPPKRNPALPLLAALGCAAVTLPEAVAAAPPGVALYRLDTQLLLPHLDEMRRLFRTENRCLDADADASALFPILRQPALRGCGLVPASGGHPAPEDAERYRLVCASERVATGQASVFAVRTGYRGALDVKMGGKNMTFSQQITAIRLGNCDP